MTEAAIAATPAAPATLEDRAAALMATLDASEDASPAEPAAETPETPVAADGDVGTSVADSAGEAAPVDAAADARRAERKARLDAVKAKERAAEEERQVRRASREKEGEAEKLRQRLAELEPLNDVFKSEEALLEAAEKKGLTADKLVQWMRTRLSDPALVAKREAQTEAEKLRAEIAEERKAREALEAKLAEKDKEAAERAEGQQKAQAFFAAIQASADTYPLTAGLYQRKGPEGLVAFANKYVVTEMPEGYSVEELHDALEQHLDEIGAAPYAPPASGPTSKKNGAAKPANTLGNDLGSERTTVTEEVPLHRLSLEERERRLKEKLERE